MGRIEREKFITRCCKGGFGIVSKYRKPHTYKTGDEMLFLCEKCGRRCDIENVNKGRTKNL